VIRSVSLYCHTIAIFGADNMMQGTYKLFMNLSPYLNFSFWSCFSSCHSLYSDFPLGPFPILRCLVNGMLVVFVDRCLSFCPFSFCHHVFCPSSIYLFIQSSCFVHIISSGCIARQKCSHHLLYQQAFISRVKGYLNSTSECCLVNPISCILLLFSLMKWHFIPQVILNLIYIINEI
jgi:hypothetical protein